MREGPGELNAAHAPLRPSPVPSIARRTESRSLRSWLRSAREWPVPRGSRRGAGRPLPIRRRATRPLLTRPAPIIPYAVLPNFLPPSSPPLPCFSLAWTSTALRRPLAARLGRLHSTEGDDTANIVARREASGVAGSESAGERANFFFFFFFLRPSFLRAATSLHRLTGSVSDHSTRL